MNQENAFRQSAAADSGDQRYRFSDQQPYLRQMNPAAEDLKIRRRSDMEIISVQIDNREKMTITDIREIDSFDEEEIRRRCDRERW